MSVTSLLVANALKVSVVVLAALGATAFLRTRPAALRHWILASAVAGALLLPALELVLPVWHFPLASATVRAPATAPQPISRAALPRVSSAPATSAADDYVATLNRVVAIVWAGGAAASLFVLLVGLGRLTWMASKGTSVVSGSWADLSEATSRANRLRRSLRIVQSDHPALLVTWGLRQPILMLPQAAQGWTNERIGIVLAHELAHIQRRDWGVQMLAELLRAVYWFNPLIWIVCRRLRQESELACDDAVLKSGVEGPAYATELLNLAKLFAGRQRDWYPAPAMARPSSLERRIGTMLNGRINRAPITRRARLVGILAVAGLAIPIAAAQTFATLSGSVFDSTNANVANVTMVLTNLQSKAKHEVKSDQTGRFEFVGLPRGEYQIEAKLPGFATLYGTLTMTGLNVQRDVTLQVGSLEETITILGAGALSKAAPAPSTRPPSNPQVAKGRLGACQPSAGGGKIRPPMKLVDRKPRYPEQLEAQMVDGLVVLNARIGTDGLVKEVDIVQTDHPDLATAAIDAVRQWEYSSTLLNCVPVEVPMRVTARFRTNP